MSDSPEICPLTEFSPETAAIEPARLQYLQHTFPEYLRARSTDHDATRIWRHELALWVHHRVFVDRATVGSVQAELHAMYRRTRIFAVTSGKGGVGKTTFSVNFAVACAQRGLSVLLFDADFGMPNVHVYTGVVPRATLLDVIDGRAALPDVLLPGPGGIHVVCGASGVSRLADLSLSAIESIGDQLLRAAGKFDVLIVDTAAGISSAVTHFLGLAHDTLVVATPALAATLDAYGVVKLLHETCVTTNLHLVVNQAADEAEAGRVRERIAGCAERYLSANVPCLGYLDRDPAFERAAQSRRPLILGEPDNVNSRRFTRIAAQLLDSDHTTVATPADPGFSDSSVAAA